MEIFKNKVNSLIYGVKHKEYRTIRYTIPADKVVASDNDGIVAAETLIATAKTLTTFENEMPYAMNVIMKCSDASTKKVTVYGKDIAGAEITEEFTLDGTTSVVGNKAFSKINKIVLPIKTGSETIDIGWGKKYGIPYKLNFAGQVIVSLLNGAADTGTTTANSEELGANVYALHGVGNGEKALDLFLIV